MRFQLLCSFSRMPMIEMSWHTIYVNVLRWDCPPCAMHRSRCCASYLAVTPSESALCKFWRNPPNPHRNDSKVPTRHLRAGGKRSNNITQQSSMGPTEQIYIQHDSMSQEYRYTEQRSKSP